MEIITGVERRRRWRVEDKLRIVAEAEAPGACFAHVAQRYELSRGLLWNWRQQVRRGALGIDAAPMFMPVQMLADTSTAATPPLSGGEAVAAARSVEGSRIEIALPTAPASASAWMSASWRCAGSSLRYGVDPDPLGGTGLAGCGAH